MKTLWMTLLIALIPSALAAQSRPDHMVFKLGGDNLDIGWANAQMNWAHNNKHHYGVELGAGLIRERFVGGYATDSGARVSGKVFGRWLLDRGARTRFQLKAAVGAQGILSSKQTRAGKQSWATTVDLDPSLAVDLTPQLNLRATVPLRIALAVSPDVELDILETPMEAELSYWLNARVALTTSVFAGGAFGYGGDGAKHRVGATFGVVYTLEDRPTPQAQTKPQGDTAAFVNMSWRGMQLAKHLSHGPGFEAGVALWRGRLKLGIGGFNRPGPLNPKRFVVKAADDLTYKGSDTLNLKSDGGVVGLLIGTHIPVTETLALDIPVMIGQGGFGFYLTGDDRETPDGRRVSAWENELQDGRDASFGLAIDAGLRVMWTPTSWLRPFIGAHYTTVVGYDAFARSSYDGVSIAMGTELLAF